MSALIEEYRQALDGLEPIDWNMLERVYAGEAVWNWHTIILDGPSEQMEIQVFRDAMKLDNVRFRVNAIEQQIIADMVGGVLPTARIEDESFRRAKLLCMPVLIVGRKHTILAKSKDYSKLIDDQIKKMAELLGHPGENLTRTVGKTWIICDRSDVNHISSKARPSVHGSSVAFNYGWHPGRIPAATPPLRVSQPVSDKYDDLHVDPGHVMLAVGRVVGIVNKGTGKRTEHDIAEVLQDRNRAGVISQDGPIKVLRQNRVPPLVTSTVVCPRSGS